MRKEEFGLKNYLNKHGIYEGNSDMQDVIINSFWIARHSTDKKHPAAGKSQKQANNFPWKEKLKYVHSKFSLFAQYAQNNWK